MLGPGSSPEIDQRPAAPGRPAARRVTAAAAIADVLRDAIVAMELVPGAVLSEKDLTARFGVSRTPVREALIRLVEEGFIEVRPQSGTFVARIPLRAIPEAVIVRQALEGATVELAAARVRTVGLGALNEAIRRQVAFAELGDRESFHEADESFHEALADLADHPGIWKIVRQAKLQIDRCRRLTLPALGRMNQVVAEHRTVVAALAVGDVAGAREAMRLHLAAVLPDARLLADIHPAFFE